MNPTKHPKKLATLAKHKAKHQREQQAMQERDAARIIATKRADVGRIAK